MSKYKITITLEDGNVATRAEGETSPIGLLQMVNALTHLANRMSQHALQLTGHTSVRKGTEIMCEKEEGHDECKHH